jgi:Family of unknown function (DUF5329)
MMKTTRWLLFLAVLFLPALGSAATPPARSTADREIDALVASIGALQGAVFVRNGSQYTAEQAASHLQLKRRKAGARIKTAEDFITYCATGSSLSGKPYQIRLANGTTVASADFLRARLRELRAGPKAPAAAMPKRDGGG